jgi:hypothetical protein
MLGKQGHERRVERAFGEQATEKVRKSEGYEECVGHGAGAEHGGRHHIADEAEYAADHRQAAHGGEGAIEFHGSEA